MCAECYKTDAGMGAVDVAILDPRGDKDTARPTITLKADGVWMVEYAATAPGLHSVNVFFAGKSIPNSPFGVVVSPGRLSASRLIISCFITSAKEVMFLPVFFCLFVCL